MIHRMSRRTPICHRGRHGRHRSFVSAAIRGRSHRRRTAAGCASRSQQPLCEERRCEGAAEAGGRRPRVSLVLKAGLGIGGQFGEGVLFRSGKAVAYYNTTGASYGLQAGAQQFGYALFFRNEAAVKALGRSEGFEVGVGPSVVVVDEGLAKQMTSKTMTNDIYAFIFNQQGLMAGLGIQGNKITRIDK